jgi:hypothetical protein
MINVPNAKLLGQMCLDNFVYDPIENELATFAAFFSNHDLQSKRKSLKRWKAVVTSNDYFEINTLSNPLYEHKMMCNLVNAAWLLVQDTSLTSEIKNLEAVEQAVYLDGECFAASCYPEHLSSDELIDPYLGIINFFEVYTLPEAHHILYEWLNKAFSPNLSVEDLPQSKAFYTNFRKLIECCWLIQHRNSACERVNEFRNEELFAEATADLIPDQLLDNFKQFLSVVPAARLNRNLRKMLLDYLQYNINGLPVDFEELLADFYWLTELLDDIEGKRVDEKFL